MTQEISASVPVRPARDALTGQAALITGAARRVGASIARMLHTAGADVVLHYRSSADDAAALARELNDSRPGSAALAECDLLQLAQLPGLVAAATAAFGGLDILVNNASTFYPTPLGDIGEIDWDDLVGTNLRSEEHTSELQSPYDLVCRLLLEKKKCTSQRSQHRCSAARSRLYRLPGG